MYIDDKSLVSLLRVVSATTQAKSKEVESYKNDLTFDDIYSQFNAGKINTVFVRFSDSSEDKVFDLTRGNDLMKLRVLHNKGEHLLGLKTKLLNKKIIKDKETIDTSVGSFVDGFTPHGSTVKEKGTPKVRLGDKMNKESEETPKKGE
jgi:hypothetical protein